MKSISIVLLLTTYCAIVESSVLRSKRIDKEQNNQLLQRVKRVDIVSGKRIIRTKRIELAEKSTIGLEKKTENPVTTTTPAPSSTSKSPPTTTTDTSSIVEKSIDTLNTNDINELPKSLLGPCRGQRINQTFTYPECQPITFENLICGGFCAANIKPFIAPANVLHVESCTFCGPDLYEEKLLFFRCKYKGNMEKIKIRTVFIPKRCGCLKQQCHVQNQVEANGHALQEDSTDHNLPLSRDYQRRPI